MAEEFSNRRSQLPTWSTVKADTVPMANVNVVHEKSLNALDRVALVITSAVGSMYCALVFAVLALVALPSALDGGPLLIIQWISQTFLQLVLLSVIMVGQKVSAAASDRQALQTYEDAEALLKIQDDVHRLIKINNDLTKEIHDILVKSTNKSQI